MRRLVKEVALSASRMYLPCIFMASWMRKHVESPSGRLASSSSLWATARVFYSTQKVYLGHDTSSYV